MKRSPLRITLVLVILFAGLLAGVLTVNDRPRVSAARKDDYLTAQLRAQVERLKSDVARAPTDPATLKDRTRVFWAWANAHALNGGNLPVNVPNTVAAVLSRPLSPSQVKSYGIAIDHFVRELQVMNEQPLAMGTLTTNISTPFVADSYQTIQQTYTFGEMPMVTGGGVLVARHFMTNHGRFQTADPAADNHVAISVSRASAKFRRHDVPLRGMHGGFRGASNVLAFRLEEGTLEKGDTFTVTYGNRSGGARGFKVQSFSNDRFPLPIYVDLEGKGNFFTLPLEHYRVIGKGVHGVHGFAPSVVKVGESFELSVRSEDVYTNRASGPVPAYEVSVGGEKVARVAAGSNAITVLQDLKFDRPGVYRFTIRSSDGAITGTSNPVWVKENPVHRIYWGETHGHSGFAEGQGTPDAYFEFGRDDARLDFLSHSEHDIWMDDSEWNTLKRNVKKYNEEGRFITFLGYEWTMRFLFGGHHNVLFRTPDGRERVPVQSAPTLSDLYLGLGRNNNAEDVLIIPHAHNPGEYRHSDPRMENLVEIMSMHGTFEWFGKRYLDHGHQVGFIAASDDHLSHPGYATPLLFGLAQPGGLAAVMAPEISTDAIFDAMKNRFTYATSGPRIILDCTLNGAAMGTRVKFSVERHIRGRVMGTAPIDAITIMKNGEPIWSHNVQKKTSDQSGLFQLRFWSETDPVVRDSPRGWRLWKGTVEVQGARLIEATSTSLQNQLRESIRVDRVDGNGPGRVEFATLTRGNYSYIDLQLEDWGPKTRIDLRLERDTENPSTPHAYRSPLKIPAQQFTFALEEMEEGQMSRSIEVGRDTDLITFQHVSEDRPLDHSFEFTDTRDPQEGDYYYLRVQQIDGHEAWSSPIWVGGHRPR